MGRFIHILFWLIAAFPVMLWGQSFQFTEHPLYYRYDQVVHLDMIQDRNGMIWTATSEGIYYYDGLTFHDIDFHGQTDDNTFTAIYEDSKGTIWAGVENGTVYMIRNYGPAIKPEWEEGFPKAPIRGFAEDMKGRLWIATYGEGLYLKDNHLININTDDGLPSNDIYSIVADADGCIWAGTDNGLAKCKMGDAQKELIVYGIKDGLADEIITTLLVYDDFVWIGTHDKGFQKLDLSDTTFSTTLNEWQYGPVTTFDIFPGRDLWIGTQRNGVFTYNFKDQKLRKVQGNDDYVKENAITILADDEKNCWISTQTGGLIHTNRQFEFYDTEDLNIQSIAGTHEGLIYLGTQEGLYYIDLASSSDQISQISQFKGLNITSLYLDEQDRLWVGTFQKGVRIYDRRKGVIQTFTTTNGLSNNNILSVNGRFNSVWVTTLGGVTMVELERSGNRENFELRIIDELSQTYIYQSFTDSKNITWFATEGKGIGKYDNGILTFIELVDSLEINSVYSITQTSDNTIWFCTNTDGIISLSNGDFRHYPPIDYQYSPELLGVAATNTNSIMLLHPLGMDEVHGKFDNITYYGDAHGLGKTLPNLNAIWKDENEDLWIGAEGRLLRYIALDGNYSIEPRLLIRDLRVDNKSIDPVQKTLDLGSHQNSLHIVYSGIWYTNPDEVYYKYKLDGLEDNWKYTRDQQISYSHLPAGEYKFMMTAAHHDHEPTEEQAYEIRFSIAKPVYQRGWFIFLMIIILTGIIYAVFKWREREISRKAELQKSHIESELKLLKDQINPHFLFNSFNTLSAYIEEDPDTAVQYVENLADFYRKILIFRKDDLIPIKEELEMIRNYYYLLKKRFGENLDMDINVKENESYIPPLSLQILVENAVKHNIVSSQKPLKIEIKSNGTDHVTVINNLQEKNGTSISTGLGLQNIKNRYKLLSNQEIVVEKDKYTFSVKIPLIKKQKL